MAVAVRPVPRSTAGRLSPISPAPSPRLVVSPRPSWPLAFVPQHLTVPLSRRAQVWAAPAADGGGGAAGAEVDGGEVVAHLAGAVAAGGGVAEAELAVGVVAPALDGAVVEEGAGVAAAGGDGGGGAAGAEVDGGEVVAHLAGVVAAVGGVAEAELADGVEAPALDRPVVEERAGVGRRPR